MCLPNESHPEVQGRDTVARGLTRSSMGRWSYWAPDAPFGAPARTGQEAPCAASTTHADRVRQRAAEEHDDHAASSTASPSTIEVSRIPGPGLADARRARAGRS